jgi:hypothetical protein
MGLGKQARWLVLAAGLLAGAAQAEVLTFKFRGTVTYSALSAPVGSEIVGRFSYDPRTKHEPETFSPGAMAEYNMAAPARMRAKVGGLVIRGEGLHVTVFNNMGGNTEDMVDINLRTPRVNGTPYPDGILGIRLASGPGSKKVFRNVKLPQEYDVDEFDAFNEGFLQSDGGPNGQLMQFVIESIREVHSNDDD